MSNRYRTVIESPDFERDKSLVTSDPRLFDEALRGVTIVLASVPESGHATPAEGIWLIYTRPHGTAHLCYLL